MGMSTHIIGIMPPTEEFNKKFAAYQACEEAGIAIPDELSTYFNDKEPNSNGMEIEIENSPAIEESDTSTGRSGFIVDVTKLPPGVTKVEFYNCW